MTIELKVPNMACPKGFLKEAETATKDIRVSACSPRHVPRRDTPSDDAKRVLKDTAPHMLQYNRFAYGACAKTITQAVIELNPKATVKADPQTKQVIVNTKVSESFVKDAIAAVGYPAA